MKITKATLKKYARKGELLHIVKNQYDGMVDGVRPVSLPAKKTKIEDIDDFWCHKNWIRVVQRGTVQLYNCCFTVIFFHPSFRLENQDYAY